jgi:ATPase subunit of ABC transporter with duplicated ATPase domains
VLVLDEPTNHLDLEAIDALIEGLRAFEGTVVFVSHDRHFVSSLATRILEITTQGPRDFPGTYAEYLEKCGDDHLDATAVVLKAKTDAKAETKTDGKADTSSWEEQKKKRNRKNSLPQLRDKALAAVEAAEARKKEIAELFASPGFFEKTLKGEVLKLQEEDAALGPKIDALIAEWEALEAELAEA